MGASRSSELRVGFGGRMAQVVRRWRQALDRRLKVYGLSEATWLALLHLSRRETPPRQKDLAEAMGIEGPSLVRLLDALEAEGLIRRQIDDDRRTKTIHLTPRARKQLVKIEAAVAAVRAEVLGGISDAEMATAWQVLEKIDKALAAGRDAASANGSD